MQATKYFFSSEIHLNKGSFGKHQTQQQAKYYTPSPSNLIKDRRLSDRFIPLNKGTNLIEKFELTKKTESQSKAANLILLDTSLANSSNRNLNSNSIGNNPNNNNDNTHNFSINNNSNSNTNSSNNVNESFFANSNNENLQSQFYSSLLQSNIFSFTANSENVNPCSRGGPIINRNLLSQSNQNNSNLLNSNSISNSNSNDNGHRSQGNTRNGPNPHLNANRNNNNNNNNLHNSNNIAESENANLTFDKENQNANKIKSKLFEFKTEKIRKNKSVFVCENNLFNSLNPNKNFNFLDFSAAGKFSGNENFNPNRKIAIKPYRVLDAPGISDDFYLNLLDWSSQNTIAIGLENQVFLWCCKKTKAYKLFSYDKSPGESRNKVVTSLIWNPNGTELAVGNNYGQTEIWDGKILY
jgi:cell division cycle 20-like protein 1 (cofactor of APC complex)